MLVLVLQQTSSQPVLDNLLPPKVFVYLIVVIIPITPRVVHDSTLARIVTKVAHHDETI
jgi:hypothetical protein